MAEIEIHPRTGPASDMSNPEYVILRPSGIEAFPPSIVNRYNSLHGARFNLHACGRPGDFIARVAYFYEPVTENMKS